MSRPPINSGSVFNLESLEQLRARFDEVFERPRERVRTIGELAVDAESSSQPRWATSLAADFTPAELHRAMIPVNYAFDEAAIDAALRGASPSLYDIAMESSFDDIATEIFIDGTGNIPVDTEQLGGESMAEPPIITDELVEKRLFYLREFLLSKRTPQGLNAWEAYKRAAFKNKGQKMDWIRGYMGNRYCTNIIDSSFTWSTTPEGSDFWNELAHESHEYFRNLEEFKH